MMIPMKMMPITRFFLMRIMPKTDPLFCIILVSRESNDPIVEWTDNKIILTGAFPDEFLFCQGVPNRSPTQQNWIHFALYYGG